jgi:hypothetical protein
MLQIVSAADHWPVRSADVSSEVVKSDVKKSDSILPVEVMLPADDPGYYSHNYKCSPIHFIGGEAGL